MIHFCKKTRMIVLEFVKNGLASFPFLWYAKGTKLNRMI